MSIPHDAQAVLLLTAHFPKSMGDSTQPLSITEWARLNKWLRDEDSKFKPSDLLNDNLSDRMEGWSDDKVSIGRVKALLSRGFALALNTDKWESSGIWVVIRSDSDYPKRIRDKLGPRRSPHVLFGCGNQKLLQGFSKNLAVVGSREADPEDLEYSRRLGRLASNSGWSIVSGGARGVDEAAMLGALDYGGTAIGVLANNLLREARSRKYRPHLESENLALISPFNPEAGFSRGNAMGRNKYIYCLADAAVVVRSDTRGGTWNGATENQKHKWVPLWVRKANHEGNRLLVEKKARWLTNQIEEIDILNPDPIVVIPEKTDSQIDDASNLPSIVEDMSFYAFFLVRAKQLCSGAYRTVDEIKNALEPVRKDQLRTWLTKAAKDNHMEKLDNPESYRWIPDSQIDDATLNNPSARGNTLMELTQSIPNSVQTSMFAASSEESA